MFLVYNYTLYFSVFQLVEILLSLKYVMPQLIRVRVISVTDGDTIRATVNGRNEHVRLIGVNAPEIGRNAQPGGREAHEFVRTHLNRKTVWLELDIQERDCHRRLLAYVWLQKPADASEAQVRGQMFNARLLLEGHAQVMTVPPNVKYADVFVAFQRGRNNPLDTRLLIPPGVLQEGADETRGN